jgi:hypothetical protein
MPVRRHPDPGLIGHHRRTGLGPDDAIGRADVITSPSQQALHLCPLRLGQSVVQGVAKLPPPMIRSARCPTASA